ncbi:hypothetical protein F4678DRAFT_484223 [Xylaria arbuscula]|nr:hypothetical protein F4678DRAFT_484223 [Xylaria arbuscula]
MDNIIDDWLSGEAWSCKAPVRRNFTSQDQSGNSSRNRDTRVGQDGRSAEADRLVLGPSQEYQWPRALPPKQANGYSSTKGLHTLFRALGNSALIGTLVYAAVILAFFEKSSTDYDTCSASSASWFESRFFIDLVIHDDLSFTQAKLLDLAWDTLIGQGLRFLHAWWLYQVATHIVTYCLETSGLTYDLLLDVLFRTDSFSSLISAFNAASGKNWTNCRLYCAWLTFAIGYILLFPTIWAASTGYSSPSITAYNLSDKAYVPIGSEDLTLCWVSNDTRLSGFLDSVIPGPPFYTLYSFNESQVPGPRTPWELRTYPSDFTSIFFYAKTKHSLQNYFHSFNPESGSNVLNSTVEIEARYTWGTRNWTDSDIHIVEGWDGLYFYDNKDKRGGWTARDLSEMLAGSQYSRNRESYYDAIFHLNDSGLLKHKDHNTAYLGPGIVPYNSTLELRNETLLLPSPFLSFGIGEVSCSWWNSSTGECPCFLGKPLEFDWAIDQKYACIGAPGYVWGFSRFILLIAITLEATWIIGCWVIRWRTTVGSNLIEYNRRNVGTIRHVLDLSEAVNRDLGPNTSIYSDHELRSALSKCPPIGYEVESKGELSHIGLVTVHHGSWRRKKIDINFDNTYG